MKNTWQWRLFHVVAIILSLPTLAVVLKFTSTIVPWFLGYVGLALLIILAIYVAFGRERIDTEYTWVGAVAFLLLWVIPFVWFAPIYFLYLYFETRWKQ